ncbi:hypothetical protein M409DRAFT_24493 [Zasmidium cellare ATCC 36951]|uniref:BTB domain-containing protein n=1 Tax=Zasmidium cellare ATCC 36951 TaxID=1080233 RepID=A0A6A6CD30_ZASCE|nr:uncharacterized protein M409DRAFT_24493 [Zasmidium cellare ATCC 36951]KAF2165107.1 hypothetical protein M409DRAFT_24493 [Zasmidium cellare ATCC 36951]
MAALASNIGALLHDPKYADLEIRCGGKSFKVHRAIVCSRSKVLDRECSGGFLEADTRIVNHAVFDVDTLERMLEFIYRGRYSIKLTSNAEDSSRGTRWCRFEPTWHIEQDEGNPNEPNIYHAISFMGPFQSKSFEELRLEDYVQDSSSSIDVLEQHVHVYAIADYYELPDLEALALQYFQAGKSSLLPICNDQLIRILEAIYSNTPVSDECLRYEILDFCIDEKKTLLKDGWFVQAVVDNPELQDFTAEFMLGLTHRHQEDLEYEQKSHVEVVKTLQDDIQRLSQQLGSAQSEVTAAAEQLKPVEENLAWYKAETERLSQHLQISQATVVAAQNSIGNKIAAQLAEFDAIRFCRHCGEDFEFYIERYGGGYVARCDDCTTRHFSKTEVP